MFIQILITFLKCRVPPQCSGWMKDWQAGDRIIVTAQEFIFGNADHLLLNLDRKKIASLKM